MGLLDSLNLRNTAIRVALTGHWELFRAERPLDADDSIQMEFTKDGRLIYSTRRKDGIHIRHLVYKVSGDVLITDQPSSPREERTTFWFDSEGDLVLEYDGRKWWFQRL